MGEMATEYSLSSIMIWKTGDEKVALVLRGKEIGLNKEGTKVFYKLLRREPIEGYKEFMKALIEKEIVMLYDPDNPKYFPPEAISIEITLDCNLFCKHCYREAGGGKTQSLSANMIEKVIIEAEELGCKGIAIGGGEPTLHPEFHKILKALDRSNLQVAIITNGTTKVLQKKKNLKILKRGIEKDITKYTIGVSMYGPKDYDDQFRGKEGAFDRSVELCNILGEANIPTNVQCIISRENKDLIPRFIKETISKLPINLFSIAPERPVGRSFRRKDKILSPEEYENTRNEIENAWKSFNIKDIELSNFPKYPHDSSYKRIPFRCSAGVNQMTIAPNGDITACTWLTSAAEDPEKYIGGNIFKDNLKDVWHKSKKFWEIRRTYKNNTCGVCMSVCSKCPVHSIAQKGSPDLPDPFCPLGCCTGKG